MNFIYMYITNDLEIALIAEKYGVQRIWIDLEILGKEERQKNMNTVKSKHSIEDIRKIKPRLTKSDMLVRINPLNTNSESEINNVISAGADLIMLPMWKTANEVNKFVSIVDNRCKKILLLETKEAVESLDEVLLNCHVDEIHIGLNDLHLSYGLTFMFELLSNGTVEKITTKINRAGIPYGFGGIARLGCGDLPAEKILKEHYRLGSSRVILSRSFCDTNICRDIVEIEKVFNENMKKLAQFEVSLAYATDFSTNKKEIEEIVTSIVNKKKGKNEIK